MNKLRARKDTRSVEETRDSLISSVAGLIREYNPTLAEMYLSRPFHRKAFAEAFAGGFKDKNNVVARKVIEATDLILEYRH